MNLNQNNQVLERLQAVYSAVLQLSEQGFNVEAVNLNGARPKLARDARPHRIASPFQGNAGESGCNGI